MLRGDGNSDGVLQAMPDAIASIEHLFPVGPAVPCEEQLDANDDGQVNIADPIYIRSWGFILGPEPPPPFPACGSDPTPDLIDCISPPACP